MEKDRPALLTQRGAADLLGVSKKTMQRLIALGTLEPVRIAGLAHPRYRRADVERIVREGRAVKRRTAPKGRSSQHARTLPAPKDGRSAL